MVGKDVGEDVRGNEVRGVDLEGVVGVGGGGTEVLAGPLVGEAQPGANLGDVRLWSLLRKKEKGRETYRVLGYIRELSWGLDVVDVGIDDLGRRRGVEVGRGLEGDSGHFDEEAKGSRGIGYQRRRL